MLNETLVNTLMQSIGEFSKQNIGQQSDFSNTVPLRHSSPFLKITPRNLFLEF